jgi:hypothetical protein
MKLAVTIILGAKQLKISNSKKVIIIPYLFGCFIFILLTITFYSCSNPTEPDLDEHNFAIYFLSVDDLKMKDVFDKDLSKLKLSAVPWLCDEDIRFYDWSSHCIYLKNDKTYFIPGWKKGERFNVFPAEWGDKPFVVVADGKRCYLGYIESLLSPSQGWIAPAISGINGMYPLDVIYIDWMWLYHIYPQNNPNVKNALIKSGLYRGGISVTFDTTDTNTLCMVENADTSTISY